MDAKIKIQIKNRRNGNILFEYEKENNTVKDTVVEAVMNGVDLSNADLREANLSGANLRGADLRRVNFYEANLSNADLREANLREASIERANLRGANLREVNLREAYDIPYIPIACPSDGAFIGWKKVNGHLIKLQIPDDAKRSSATTNKCRCDKANVLSIIDLNDLNPITEIKNRTYNPAVIYKVGEMVYPDSFDEDRWNECSHGIHFFINKQDAINY